MVFSGVLFIQFLAARARRYDDEPPNSATLVSPPSSRGAGTGLSLGITRARLRPDFQVTKYRPRAHLPQRVRVWEIVGSAVRGIRVQASADIVEIRRAQTHARLSHPDLRAAGQVRARRCAKHRR